MSIVGAGQVAAQVEPTAAAGVQTAEAALAQDAATWATRAGLTPADALARLRAQTEGAATTDALARDFAGRLAGVWIEQRPDYRIVVRLTGDAPVSGQSVVLGGMAVPVEFRTGAPVTREALLVALADRQAALREALKQPPGIGIDPRTGTLVVLAGAADVDREGREALATRLTAIAGVPVSVRVWGARTTWGSRAGRGWSDPTPVIPAASCAPPASP